MSDIETMIKEGREQGLSGEALRSFVRTHQSHEMYDLVNRVRERVTHSNIIREHNEQVERELNEALETKADAYAPVKVAFN